VLPFWYRATVEAAVAGQPDVRHPIPAAPGADVTTVADLARLLRQLRRRQARQRNTPMLTYRQLAAQTGWSHGIIGEYFAGNVLPPTDRFDVLVRLLGATSAEQGSLATARDRVEEQRRGAPSTGGQPWHRWAVPRQLPATVVGFTGRTGQLAELNALLSGPAPASAVVVSAIGGTAGVGKTALAVHWAHAVADRFPDGQLYVNLRGFDPGGSAPMAPAQAVRGFLDAFGVPTQQIPVTLDAQAGLYRSLLAGRRVLAVLDNARDVDQVRPLLPGAPGCLVVVTSRNQLTPLVATEGAHPLTLDLLSVDEARDLLARRLGATRIAAEPQAVDEIIERCARLPLALAIAAARAASHPRFPLARIAEQLREARSGLDALAGGDPATDVRAVFSWSYHTLSAHAATLFRQLGLHPGPDLTQPAAASIAGVPADRARAMLAELTRANLLAERSVGRYTLHDLLRAYAAEQAHRHDSDSQRRAAQRRTVDHYRHTAHAAAGLLDPHRRRYDSATPEPGVTPERFDDADRALAWLAAEHPVLVAIVGQTAGHGWDRYTTDLARSLWTFFDRRGHWHHLATTQRLALAAGVRTGERFDQAEAHRGLARALTRQGSYDDAAHHLCEALQLYGELDDLNGQAQTHIGLGIVVERRGLHWTALSHTTQALRLYQTMGDRAGQAVALNAVGWDHAQLGDHHQALRHCREALALHQELGDRHGEAKTWDSLGYIHRHLDDRAEATTCYQHAIDLFRQLGDRYYEAEGLTGLAEAHYAAGDDHGAHDAWRHALVILRELDHPDAELIRAHLRAVEDRPESRRSAAPTGAVPIGKSRPD
jgi:tetratricopeptide (TPR) repeat protein